MRRLGVLIGLVLILAAHTHAAASAGAPLRWQAGTVEVMFEQSRHAAVLGDRFTFRSRVANSGALPTDRLIAHLNVASLTGDVYVDPEDWSSSRTLEVAPVSPRSSTSLSWEIQAVNAGSFAVYVVLLPGGGAAGAEPLVVSPPVHVRVAGRRTLNAGGSLPVVIVVPVLLGLVTAAMRYRIRRAG
jgi:hypothetical protein